MPPCQAAVALYSGCLPEAYGQMLGSSRVEDEKNKAGRYICLAEAYGLALKE